MADQNYTTEQPEPREVEVDRVEEQIDGAVSPAADLTPHLDLNDGKVDVQETRVSLDTAVGPNDPNAVIVPPEGRGVHPELGVFGKPTPEQVLASGDATEATGVVDGKPVTSSEAAKAEKADAKKS